MLILLDIDGVMVPAKSWQSPPLLNDGFPAFSQQAVAVLRKVISGDTTVMLTTSHRHRFSIMEWKEIFLSRGIDITRLEKLDDSDSSKSRKDEILDWFHTAKSPENFVIIDDDKGLNDLPQSLKEKLILTSSYIGLNESHLSEILAVMDRKLILV